jgi:hypothetical protein
MPIPPLTTPALIAPCGIDCRLCHAFARRQVTCPGCRGEDTFKSPSCAACRIKNCVRRASLPGGWCYECEQFPCFLIKRLDKRYRTKYGAHPIENLLFIRDHGLQAFVELENRRWACPRCGQVLCMHKPHCLSCGYEWGQPAFRQKGEGH